MEIKNNEIIAAENKYIHRKGSDAYFRRCTLLKNETIDNFEEVETIPEQSEDTNHNYKEEVIQRIRQRYSVDDELAILRQRETKPDEYREYFDYVEQIKKEIKDAQSNTQR